MQPKIDLTGYGTFFTVAQAAAALRANPESHRTLAERIRKLAPAERPLTVAETIEHLFGLNQPREPLHEAIKRLIPHPVEDEHGPLEPVDVEALR